MSRLAYLFGTAFLLSCSVAQAHFIWLDQGDNAGKPQLLAYFGETAEPGEGHLLGKIAHTKAWVRDAAGKKSDLSVKTPGEGDKAALSADCPASGATSLEAFCDYGVYSHGGPGFLLQYYAKHLAGDWVNNTDQLARAEKLLLDVVPSTKDKHLTLTVLYQGKPASGKDVVVVDPADKQHDLTTDADGKATLPDLMAGKYAVRANVIEADKSGERDGKKFGQTWHYCTLTFNLPESIATKTATVETKSSDPSAVAALTKARAGRSMWEEFPGFTTDVTVSAEGKQAKGKATIESSGAVTLEMADQEISPWLEEQLNSLVQHRMPDGEVAEGKVTWSDDDVIHPLGRKIDLGDPKLKSAYRLKDDVIMEVNRTAGPTMHFTISVLEIEYNPEGKYLPRSFTMNFFDNKTGEVKTSLAYLNEWQRVGQFDLPKTIIEVNTKAGKSVTKRIEFANTKLVN
jgi:hypothetical protein